MSDSNIKLKAALKEIEHIVRKYDVGAYIELEDKGGSEFKLMLPTWSAFKFKQVGNEMRGHLKMRKANIENCNATVGMFISMQNRAAQQFSTCEAILKQVKDHFEIVHWEKRLD